MYSVTWTLDVEDPATPERAALQAYFTMQRREMSANCFEVQDERGESTRIDLESLWDDPRKRAAARANAQSETQFYLVAATGDRAAVQASGPTVSREALDAQRVQVRDRFPANTRFFCVEINPFSIAVVELAASGDSL